MEKTKKIIVNHVKKHHKKYIFGVGTMTGIAIFIIGVLLGSILGGKGSYTNNDELEMYKSLDVFNKINDIAHLEFEEHEEEGHPFTEEGKKIFEQLDLEFYNDKNVTEKFRTAKKIVEFLIEQEKYHANAESGSTEINTDAERDAEFVELLNQFNQIQ